MARNKTAATESGDGRRIDWASNDTQSTRSPQSEQADEWHAYTLDIVRCAARQARYRAGDVDTVGVLLNRGLIGADEAMALLDEIGALDEVIQAIAEARP